MNRHRLEAIYGTPFPVDKRWDEVPLAWFLEQGATAADIVKVLHPVSPWLLPEERVPYASVSENEAWYLLDELICRDCIPGPIHPYTAPNSPILAANPRFTDVWNELWG